MNESDLRALCERVLALNEHAVLYCGCNSPTCVQCHGEYKLVEEKARLFDQSAPDLARECLRLLEVCKGMNAVIAIAHKYRRVKYVTAEGQAMMMELNHALDELYYKALPPPAVDGGEE